MDHLYEGEGMREGYQTMDTDLFHLVCFIVAIGIYGPAAPGSGLRD